MYYCTRCRQEVESKILRNPEMFRIKNDPVIVKRAKVRVCEHCGKHISDSYLENLNLNTATDLYIERMGLVSRKQMMKLMKTMKLSKRGFYKKFGCSPMGIPTVSQSERIQRFIKGNSIASRIKRMFS